MRCRRVITLVVASVVVLVATVGFGIAERSTLSRAVGYKFYDSHRKQFGCWRVDLFHESATFRVEAPWFSNPSQSSQWYADQIFDTNVVLAPNSMEIPISRRSWPTMSFASTAEAERGYSDYYGVVEFGWPYRFMSYVWEHKTPQNTTHVQSGWRLGALGHNAPSQLAYVMPTDVMLGPCMLNVVFWMTVLTAIYAAKLVMTNLLRRRRGCCTSCGYSLTALTGELCPECGTALMKRSASRVEPAP